MNEHDPIATPLAALLAEYAGNVVLPHGSLVKVRRRAAQRRQRTRVAVSGGTVLAVGGFAALAVAGSRGPAPQMGVGDTTVTTPVNSGSTADSRPNLTPATPLATIPAVIITESTAPPTHLARDLKRGDYGDDVGELQTRLSNLGFDTNGIDGQFGTGTQMAVWAFEGLFYERGYEQQTGVVTDEMWQAMQQTITFVPRRAEVAAGATHVEIHLPLQVLTVFTDGQLRLATHISSGSGEQWCEVISQDTDDNGGPLAQPILKDVCGVSKTPGGVFHFYRSYEGKRLGPLGGMWNPVYFNYGIAVHGADNVPAMPVSHGAVRIPQWVAEYFPTLVNSDDRDGDYVYVWGMDGKEPEEYTRDESLPIFNYANPNSTLVTTTA